MHVTIWRHGEAGSAASDRLRQLTPRGRSDVQCGRDTFLQLCRARGIAVPEQLLFSEWRRTAATAQLIAGSLVGAVVTPLDALVPGRLPVDVERALETLWGADSPEHVLLVSHQPLVSQLADYLVGEPGRVPALVPGGFVTLAMDCLGPGLAQPVCCAQPPGYTPIA